METGALAWDISKLFDSRKWVMGLTRIGRAEKARISMLCMDGGESCLPRFIYPPIKNRLAFRTMFLRCYISLQYVSVRLDSRAFPSKRSGPVHRWHDTKRVVRIG